VVGIRRSHLKCDKPPSVEPCHSTRVTYNSHHFLVNPMNSRRATKVFTDNYDFQKSKRQLAEYPSSEGLTEGYYVVFSNLHTDEDEGDFEEEILGKRIYTYILRIRFDPPSQLPPVKQAEE